MFAIGLFMFEKLCKTLRLMPCSPQRPFQSIKISIKYPTRNHLPKSKKFVWLVDIICSVFPLQQLNATRQDAVVLTSAEAKKSQDFHEANGI